MNRHPKRRRRPHDPDVVAAVRRSLDRNAADAPTGEHFAERVLAALDRAGEDPYAPLPRPPRRRRVLVPALSAAAVLVVIAAVVLAVAQFGGNSRRQTASSPTPTVSAPTTVAPTTASPTPTQTDSTASADGAGNSVISFATLSNVQIQDVTFTGTDDGWALASADCLLTSGRCTALLRTTDGKVWKSHPNTPFNVHGVQNCAAPCVTNLRFATDDIGYAFGPSAFFITTDGGDHWHKQAGGALGLETADGNVVRVTSSGSGCPGPCDIGVETAAIGSTTWTRRDVGDTQVGAVTGAQLSRNGQDVYLLVTANPAGGAGRATSVLFRSADDGTTWASTGEPCPQTGGERDSTTLGSGDDGRVGVLCLVRGSADRLSLATSGDAGRDFTGQGALPSAAATLTAGPPGVWLAGGRSLLRTVDDGDSWTTVDTVGGPVSWVGFESAVVARAVTDGGSDIWTTRDGGRTWTSIHFQ